MLTLTPDIAFKKKLEESCGASLSSCIQCGTCSVVCRLSPEERPFPRKEMVYAGWGMKDQLVGNPDVWLCHQCGDCTSQCPRGVNPAEVLAGVRDATYRQYARPKFLGKLMESASYLPLAILFPVLIIGAIIYAAGTLSLPEGPVNYSAFFPHAWLNGSFSALAFISYGVATIGFVKFWKDMKRLFPGGQEVKFWSGLWSAKNDILAHNRFGKCERNRSRQVAHFLVFYGFVLLLLVTLYAIYAAVTEKYPLGLLNPFKMLGNLSSVMLIIGLTIMIVNRLKRSEGTERSTYADWLLLTSMLLLTLSGIIIEAARFLDWGAAYHLYFFHLVCVWFVIIYLPFTKFGHVVYRTLAMTFAYSLKRK